MRLIPSKFKYNLLVDFDISGIRIFNCQNFEDFNYDYLFKYREDTYLYEKSSNSYKYLQLDVHQSFRDIKSNSSGLSEKDHQNLMKLFGSWTMEISAVFDVVLSPCEFRRILVFENLLTKKFMYKTMPSNLIWIIYFLPLKICCCNNQTTLLLLFL